MTPAELDDIEARCVAAADDVAHLLESHGWCTADEARAAAASAADVPALVAALRPYLAPLTEELTEEIDDALARITGTVDAMMLGGCVAGGEALIDLGAEVRGVVEDVATLKREVRRLRALVPQTGTPDVCAARRAAWQGEIERLWPDVSSVALRHDARGAAAITCPVHPKAPAGTPCPGAMLLDGAPVEVEPADLARLARLVDVRDAPAVTLHADDAHDLHDALTSLATAIHPEALEPAETFVERLMAWSFFDTKVRDVRTRDAFWQRTAATFAARADEQERLLAAEREARERAETDVRRVRSLVDARPDEASDAAVLRAIDAMQSKTDDAFQRDAQERAKLNERGDLWQAREEKARLAAIAADDARIKAERERDEAEHARELALTNAEQHAHDRAMWQGYALRMERLAIGQSLRLYAVAKARDVLAVLARGSRAQEPTHHPHVDRHNAGARAEAIIAGHSVACAMPEAQTRLALPPPSLRHAYTSVAEAVRALRARVEVPFVSGLLETETRRAEAIRACEACGRALDSRGPADVAYIEAWGWAVDVFKRRDNLLREIEDRARELAAGAEEMADGCGEEEVEHG